MKNKRALAAAMSTALLAIGLSVAAAAPASAATCQTTVPAQWSVKNISCGTARHYVNTASGYHYGNYAGRGAWSNEAMCYSGLRSYGVTVWA